MSPDASAQHRKIPLIITPGLDGYRLAFAAGDRFEVLAEYPTFEQAERAFAIYRMIAELRS
jgi:hypothetical protein